MFLKVISANLRGSISICSSLGATSAHTLPVSRNKLLQLISVQRSTLQYSTEKTASKTNNYKTSHKNDQLSHEEIQALNQDPDSFGTLSSFKPSVQEKPIVQPIVESESEEKAVSKTKSSNRKSADEYETSLKNIINEKGVQEAVRIFEDEILKIDRFWAPVRMYEWLINECLTLNCYEKAFDLYEQMVNRGLKVTLSTIEKLTLAFESSNLSIKKVISLRKIITKYKYEPNACIYNAMIRIHVRAKQWPAGFELAEEMVQRSFDYEFDTIIAMLEACRYDQNDGFNRLLVLWHEMQRLGYTPNIHVLNALLNAVHRCQINDVDKLVKTVESIQTKWQASSKETNLEPNSTEIDENPESHDTIDDGRPNLLKIPPKIGHLFPLKNVTTPEERLLILCGFSEILTMIRVYDIIPTLDTIKALLKLTPNSFLAQHKVICFLKKHNITPDITFFNILLTKVCMRQDFKDAMEIIEMMYTLGVDVDLVSYGLLAMTCKTATEANQFFDEIDRNNLQLDDDIMNAMLKNACAAGDNDFLISILRKMRSTQTEPIEESVNLVEEYHRQVFQNLRTQRKHTKQTRNECFKLARECKAFLKHFQLDKRSDNNKSKRIEAPTKVNRKSSHEKQKSIQTSV